MTDIELKLEGLSVQDKPGKSNDDAEHSKTQGEGSTSTSISATKKYGRGENPKLRYKKPYWWPYRTFVKQRYVPTPESQSLDPVLSCEKGVGYLSGENRVLMIVDG